MRPQWRSLLTGLAALVCLLVSKSIARADTVVGAAAPLTGPEAYIGEQLQRGTELAVADINAAGGVLGQKVRLVSVDDACDARQGVAAAEKLVSEQAVFVVGHVCSSASIAASAVYNRAGIVQISPSSTNPRLTELGRTNVFRLGGRDDQQGAIAADYIAQHWHDAKVAIVSDGRTYGKGLADEVKKDLNRRGIAEVLRADIAPGQSDYPDLMQALQAAGTTILYYGGYSSEGAIIARAAHDLGLRIQLVSGDAVSTDQFMQIAGPGGEGTLFTFAPDARRGAAASAVVARFRNTGYEPEGYTLASYAAMQVWSQAAAKAGSFDIAKVISALHSMRFDTVIGPVEFDEKGDIKHPGFVWYVWNATSYAPME